MSAIYRWLIRRRLLLTGAMLVILAVGWWFSAYPRGMLAAWADHSRGHYELKGIGLPPPWAGEYARLVLDRYGVAVNSVAGCVVTQDLVWYVDGYNVVSKSRIQARFGKDIFAECAEEARAAWEREHGME
ncbi:MAG: hypothetical protein JWO38_529 [Gemmataceae bacterium]|nr:hypothetical protein [Gemmataceae bacterium]